MNTLKRILSDIERKSAKNTALPPRKAQKARNAPIIAWGIAKAILLAYLVLVLLLSLLETKQLLGLTAGAYVGASSLNDSVKSAKAKDLNRAQQEADFAERNLSRSLDSIKNIRSSALSYLPLVGGQLKEVEHLVTATELLARGLSQGYGFANELKQIADGNKSKDYSSFSSEQKRALLEKIYASTPELNGLAAVFSLALDELNKLELHGILWPAKYQILQVRDKVSAGSQALQEAVPLSQILPSLAGYPATSTFLVVLQNSDELRPTGGFIGTYGILETANGDIARFDTHDIYHMDMPAESQVQVTPPEPIKLYLNSNWYMRDANWSPDWPTAARQLQWFYALENRFLTGKNDINRFDGPWSGVIAINPRLVSALIRLVGPITVDGQTYTAENFSQVLEFEVEQGYQEAGTSKWQRKEVIGKIVRELKVRLLNLPSSEWQNLLSVLNGTFLNRDLQLYFNDSTVNSIAQANGWGGELKNVNGDYAMVVDSNFASLKTDAVISRDIAQKREAVPGGIKATVSITYHHSGLAKDWRTDRYKDYLRLFVPAGSRLISFEGAAVEPQTTNEDGKTVFGSLVYIELNSSKTVTIGYLLPKELADKWRKGSYSLYWQKQPGSRVEKAKVDVILPSEVESISPLSGVISPDKKQISWPLDLTKDQEISLNF
jgi:hypothetical protein